MMYLMLDFDLSFNFSKYKKIINDIGKNKPITRVEVAIAANKENNKMFLIFNFLKILKAKKIEKTTKLKKMISLLL